jgi:hypothetical protein
MTRTPAVVEVAASVAAVADFTPAVSAAAAWLPGVSHGQQIR